jgi:hypothetical protein
MPEHQTIIVTQNNSNDGGCLGGCGTVFALMLVVGLVVTYWYVAVAVAVVAAGIGIWLWNRGQSQVPAAAAPAIPAGPGPLDGGACATCGQTGSGNFCQHCGTARGRTCADCGRHGLGARTAHGADPRPTPLPRQRPERPMHRQPALAASRLASAGGERFSAAFLLKVPAFGSVPRQAENGIQSSASRSVVATRGCQLR